MISQSSNNKYAGQPSKQCDAGLPIMGRVNETTGAYQILKVNPDGSLPIPAANTPVIDSAFIGLQPALVSTPGGSPPANTFLAGISPQPQITESGVYRINPVFIYGGTTGGGISFCLLSATSTLGAYYSGLPVGNSWAPTIADLTTGLYAFWHNTVSQQFGTNLMISYNRDNTVDVYLAQDNYYLAVISDGSVNFSGFGAIAGFYEFSKIG